MWFLNLKKCPYMIVWIAFSTFGQSDSVDVTFYYSPKTNPSIVYLAGEFNQWANNQAGWITDPKFAMTYDPITQSWTKTVRLRVGGPFPLPNPGKSIPGAYQYKFNENGSLRGWKSDPLNPRQNPMDMNNSYVFATDPVILYLLPNSVSGLVASSRPEISVSIFPGISSELDTSTLVLQIDDQYYSHLGSLYDFETHTLRFTPPHPLSNGTHFLKISCQCFHCPPVADSTTFIVQAGKVRFLTRSNPKYIRPTLELHGIVEDTSIHEVQLIHNETAFGIPVSLGRFVYTASLVEGQNWFKVISGEDGDSVQVVYFIDHTPKPTICMSMDGQFIRLVGKRNDPDGDPVSYQWNSDDAKNPLSLHISSTDSVLRVPIPSVPGEYFFDLTVQDPQGHTGKARTFFKIRPSNEVILTDHRSNPDWIRDAIIYEIFLPAFTPNGTLREAKEQLSWIRELGANTIWLMPIYPNGETVNTMNAGYNVADFYHVHPQFGTLQDLKDFVQTAHDLSLRVILDSTPNHVGEKHPWIQEILLYGDYANTRPMIETRILGDHRGMGQYAFQQDGYTVYVHYNGWALANLNYSAIETRMEMLDMYRFWLLEQDIDGFRMDVYWGPENRYGAQTWWRPFREEVKRIKPETLILGETDATGIGAEKNYADGGGACDACYDWNFYHQLKQTLQGGSIEELDKRMRNYSPTDQYNFYTGSNSFYLRFLENHDEDRIASLFSIEKIKLASVLVYTGPGIPLMYAGQEVGETRKREPIRWNQNQGEQWELFYKKLIGIRNRFPTFRSDRIVRIPANRSNVYAYARLHSEENAVVVINFLSAKVQTNLNLSQLPWSIHGDSLVGNRPYFLNDVWNDTAYTIAKSQLSAFPVTLSPYDFAIFVLSDTLFTHVSEHVLENRSEESFLYLDNFPNPFNSTTRIQVKWKGTSSIALQIEIVNLLGQTVKQFDFPIAQEEILLDWDGRNENGIPLPSGIYFCRVKSEQRTKIHKLALIR